MAILWMDKIRSHQFETMVETTVCWYLQGIRPFRWASERWCKMDFATIHSMAMNFREPLKSGWWTDIST